MKSISLSVYLWSVLEYVVDGTICCEWDDVLWVGQWVEDAMCGGDVDGVCAGGMCVCACVCMCMGA